MAGDRSNNLVALFFDRAAEKGDKPFLWTKQGEVYQPRSWAQVAADVAHLAAALKTRGIEPGDRVALVSENRPEWLIADLAIMAAGAVTVPTYTTNTRRDHLHILENSGAKGAILSTRRLATAFLPAAHQSDPLGFVIAMEDPKIAQSINAEIHLWDDAIGAEKAEVTALHESAKGVVRDQTACIIYTSGTGGAPKGVLIHHGAILHNCESAKLVLDEISRGQDAFLSFLPLSHAYEHTAGQFLPIFLGAEIYYAESIEKLAANMQEAKPTVMVVVPRLFELLRNRLIKAMEKESATKQKLFARALELGRKRYEASESLTFKETIEDALLERTVRRKVRKRFGGRLKALVSGGAPLSPEVGLFFTAIGLPLLQGYGQTESGPVVSVNRPSAPKMHTVGPPLADVEVKIAKDGEILLKGELVMQGYWRDEDATAEALKEGWLHTGDVGHLDQDGHLIITDRKKDLIVNDKGDNVSPQRIEGMLTLEPEIAQVMVFGDRKPYLVGLVVPDAEWLLEWCKAHKKPVRLAEIVDDEDLKRALGDAVSRVNGLLNNLERVRRFAIASEPFTIENEQMTPTMKIRRHVISKVYESQLEAMY